MRSLTVAAAALCMAAPANAETFDGCFVRTYDAAHLAEHKGQTVSLVKLKLKPRDMNDGFNLSAELRFGFRDDKRDYYAVGICKQNDRGLYCALDQDAGEFNIKSADAGLQLAPIHDLRADSSTGEEDQFVMIKQTNPEDRLFALRTAPATDCKEFDDAE